MTRLSLLLRDRLDVANSRVMIQSLVLTALVALAAFWGAFRYLDAGLEDRLVRLAPVGSDWQAQVLILESVPAEDAVRAQLLERLLAMKPRLVVWAGAPVTQAGRTLIHARPAHGERDSPADGQVFQAMAFVAPAEYGIHRYQDVRMTGAQLPPLEVATLRALGRESALPAEAYRVNFRLSSGGLPRVRAAAVLNGRVIDEVIQDRVVLVGVDRGMQEPRWLAPVEDHPRGLTQLEFHAYALETLLSGRIPVLGDGLLALVSVLVTGMLSLGLCALLISRLGLWLLLPFLVVAVGVWLSLFFALEVFLPLLPMLFTGLALVVLFRLQLAHRRSDIIEQLAAQTASRVAGRLTRDHDLDEAEEWSRIVAMVSQMLNLQRSIFLTVRKEDHFVREVASLGCQLDDICEMRRDYHRSPYTDALEARALIRLQQRLFLRENDASPDEEQYMLPVLLEGELQGFWCLTVAAGQVECPEELERQVKPFAAQIAQRMYHLVFRRRAESETGADPEVELDPELRLRGLVTLLESRIVLFENVFQGLSTATIVYDVFGRVQHVNNQMSMVLASEDYQPYQKTALEVLIDLGGVPPQEARDHLRYVVVENGRVSLPSRIRVGKGFYQMQLSPVTVLAAGADAESQVGAAGVVFELQDLSGVEGQFVGRESLVEHVITNLRNHCTSLMMLRRLLARGDLDPRRARAMEKFGETLGGIMVELDQAQEYLEQPVTGAMHKPFPLSPGVAVREALEELEALRESRSLEVVFEEPLVASLALGARDLLREGLVAVLQLVMEDARENSELRVTISETERMVRMQIGNDGFGIPEEDLAGFIAGNDPDISEVFIRISLLSNMLESWGGLLLASSGVGKGYRFLVALPKLA